MQALFWILFSVVFWCYIGYPLVMAFRASLWPRFLCGEEPASLPRVSVVLAVRNGAEHLARRVENLLAQDYEADRIEVLVVCNGCMDTTETVAHELAAQDSRVRVLISPGEQGKAGAINRGVGAAEGECVVFADVRQTFAPDAILRLVQCFADPEVGAVSGRLVIQRANRPAVEGVRWYWRMETALRMAESRTGSVVGATGAIYAIRRSLFQPLPINLILDDVAVPMRIALAGGRVILQEYAVAFDLPSPGHDLEYQRKRRTMVGNLQLLRVMPELLSPRRNPLWGRFVSHKLLRLASPFCFLGMLVTAGLIPLSFYQLVFWAEAAIYVAGLAGLLVPLPFVSISSAFVLVHVAILSAVIHFRQDAATVWEAPTIPVTSSAGAAATADLQAHA